MTTDKLKLRVTIEYGDVRVVDEVPLRGKNLVNIDMEETCHGIKAIDELAHVLQYEILYHMQRPNAPTDIEPHPRLIALCHLLCQKIQARQGNH